MRKYKCALRRGDAYCPVFWEAFPKSKCNENCPAFTPRVHKCESGADGLFEITRWLGLGPYVQGHARHIDDPDEEYASDIDYCPYCGERLTLVVPTLEAASKRLRERE